MNPWLIPGRIFRVKNKGPRKLLVVLTQNQNNWNAAQLL